MTVHEPYFDEDVPVEVARYLASRGFVVRRPGDIGALAADDHAHLRECTSRGWILITRKRRDFRRLHWLWSALRSWGALPAPHAGILTIYHQDTLVLEWARAIETLLVSTDSLSGQMYMWRASTRSWERQSADWM